MQVLRVIFQSIQAPAYTSNIPPSEAAACSKLLSSLFTQLIAWVQQIPSEEQQMASDVVAVFLPALEYLPAKDIVQLLYSCLSALEENKPHCCILLELVPQCLLAIAAAASMRTEVQPPAAAADAATAEQAAQDGSQGKEEPLADTAFYRYNIILGDGQQRILLPLSSAPTTLCSRCKFARHTTLQTRHTPVAQVGRL